MLLNDFFYIKQVDRVDGTVKALVSINKTHKIFEGHFPTIPIVPGVCMMQMMKEIMEHQLGKALRIQTGDNVKFLSVINPTEHSDIEATIHYQEGVEGIKINATLFAGAITFFKLKAILQLA